MKILFSKFTIFAVGLAVFFVMGGVFLGMRLERGDLRFSAKKFLTAGVYEEISDIGSKQWTFKEYANYFGDLAQKKGGEYAYKVLQQASIAPNIDMHLLGHIVSDEIYKQQGTEGITVCDDDFRNACSHAIVVGVLLEKGESALQEIRDACRRSPGGRGAYTMCFHGLGHGVLAYSDFDLKKAAALCKKTGTPQYRNREHVECIGGAVMEIIGGGFHNRELWSEQRKNFLSFEDFLSPCNKEFIPKEARPMCYTYLTPHLLTVVGADLGAPSAENFKNAFSLCDRIGEEDRENREACWGGFGKEFVVLAKARDVRNIEHMTDEELSKAYSWCLLAEKREGKEACLRAAVSSLFWGGENDPDVSIRFCKLVSVKDLQSSCFTGLISFVGFYIGDMNSRKEFCTELPPVFLQECQVRLF